MKKINVRKIALFLLISFSSAWILFGIVYFKSAAIQMESLGAILAIVMFVPAIATIAVKRLYKEPISKYGFGFKKYEYIILAWLLPVIFAVIAAFFTILFGLAAFDPYMSDFLQMFPEKMIEQGVPPYYIVFLFSLFLPVVINSLFTIGEELGWRGFLQDELKSLGQIKSYLIIGLIWGVWHIPIIAMGHNYPSNPILGPIWMIIFCVLLSFIFGWLKDKSESLWAPVIAHASLNGPAMTPLLVMSGLNRLFGSIFGLIGFAIMGAFVAWLIASKQISG